MRFRFKHASADRTSASAVLVQVQEGSVMGFGEACPRPYVTGETVDSVLTFLSAYAEPFARRASCLRELVRLIDDERDIIDRHPSAFCGLETAILDMLARKEGLPMEQFLGYDVLRAPLTYSAILGDASPMATRALIASYRLAGFSDFKFKLSTDPERDARRIRVLSQRLPVRVDANNLYQVPEDCLSHITALDRPIWAVEEPLAAQDFDGQTRLAQLGKLRIILDESVTRLDQLDQYRSSPRLFLVNLRVSKCGGVLRSVALGRAAQSLGLDVILGAHVGETSILTRAAMTVGQGLTTEPVAREGAYGNILLRSDATRPSLRFAYGGRLSPVRYDLAKSPGWGCELAPPT